MVATQILLHVWVTTCLVHPTVPCFVLLFLFVNFPDLWCVSFTCSVQLSDIFQNMTASNPLQFKCARCLWVAGMVNRFTLSAVSQSEMGNHPCPCDHKCASCCMQSDLVKISAGCRHWITVQVRHKVSIVKWYMCNFTPSILVRINIIKQSVEKTDQEGFCRPF